MPPRSVMWSASKSAVLFEAQLNGVVTVPPVPASASWCGLPGALSVIVTLALRAPEAPGVNVTEIEQDAPAASVLGLIGQLFVWAKSLAFEPVTARPVIDSGALPTFVSVDDWAALVVPTPCEAKVRAGGVSATAGAGGGGAPVLTVRTENP